MERQYKDSGIEWIGRIPEGWDVKRLKNLCVSSNSLIADGDWIESQDISDEGIRYYTTGNIGDGVFKEQGNGFITESTFDKLKCTPVYPGDLVFSRLNVPIGRSCIIPNIYPICVVAVDNVIVRPDSSYDKQYLMYVSMCPGYQETNMLIARGTTMQRMSRTQLENIYLPIPPLPEQQRIASYLDKKCGEIDELIALQEKMIAQLTEYKQAVITEAVTKGLDPNAKLVPSGIEWIGDVPEGWSIIKVGFIFDNLDYLREPISAELRERNNPQYDYYGASGVIDRIDHYNVDDKVLLIGEDGANLVMRNLPLIYKAEGKFWVNNHAHILKPKKDDYDFMALALEAADYHDYITGSAQPKLSQENLQAVKIPVPPLPEQQRIASYLDTKCSEIDSLIALKRQKIESLNAYKKSIIYEAVTGKTII